MILYRIQHKDNAGSMWYNPDGSPNRIVDTLSDKRLASLPMEYDERYRKDGRIWQCAANSLDNLAYWFSPQDRVDLKNKGFVLAVFNAEEYEVEEHQTIFTRNSITEIKIYDNYDLLETVKSV